MKPEFTEISENVLELVVEKTEFIGEKFIIESESDPKVRPPLSLDLGRSRLALPRHSFVLSFPSPFPTMLGGISNRIWEQIVMHASQCVPDDKLYSYTISGHGVGLLFNSVYKLVGATFDGQNYQLLSELMLPQKVLASYPSFRLQMTSPRKSKVAWRKIKAVIKLRSVKRDLAAKRGQSLYL
ncbi:hypothetical protein ACFE04_024318 [Oxalis oulophora]